MKSPTWDEPGYLGLGAYLLEHGRWDVPGAGSHPPLTFYVQALPFLAYPIDGGAWTYPGRLRDLSFLRAADTDRGNGILGDRRYDGEVLLLLCRLTSLVFAALLLVSLWRWSARLWGPAGATLSLTAACLSPNLLAHAALATTDYPLAATYLAAICGLVWFLESPSPRRLALAGLLGGLALATKLSALLWAPTAALLLAWTLVAAPEPVRLGLSRFAPVGNGPWRLALGGAAAGALLLATAAATVWALCGFRVDPYLTVLRSQLWDLSSGHEAYLLGRYSTAGWWYYFPVAFLLKTPLPTLALAALGAAALPARGRWHAGLLLVPPALFFAAFVLSRGKAIGLRYLLPVYPFLFLVAGGLLAGGWDAAARWRRRSAVALCAALAVACARIHPDHLAYFNELAGGPDGGRWALVDSNLDWGQDLKGLKRWMDRHGVARIKLSYFGTADPALYGLDYEWLPSYVLPRRDPAPVALPTTGWIAISATNLAGVYLDAYGHGKTLFHWLEAFAPVARIGHSILVYYIPDDAFGEASATP